ncbi:LGT_TIGR03299, phage/plasmid-like protein TIGR03299 [uncultured Caudovirales phage]|uniref:LGT_TIGR03299, phage/plasmid-like protein TIGR03299 n=1 Tax=uncultured Caudovirales phage TaxID=2100421 RepID=A0A6J5LF11_9CAUD|nr:LGT_TIGR03299, phage/plasmid-like protein TIGR03299 [uncultured Caudovirales phage]
MAHMVETMAYAGETPWHGLGYKVPADLTPAQMLEAAGLDWTVSKVPAYAEINGVSTPIGRSALVRSSDSSMLDVVSDDWNPIQNQEAFEFFNEFIAAGDMEMHTAGSLRDGQIVWGLAKVRDSFELFKGDQVDSYLLFSNFHRYGFSTDVRFTPIRVVCNNTLTLSLNSKVENFVKISHRSKFDADSTKEMLGIAKEKLAQYKDMASFLGSKMAKTENIVEYFNRIFPATGKKDASRNAERAMEVLHTQPGANFAEGTWWQPFNAVTYLTDHELGRTADSRLAAAWYGYNKSLKTKALEVAVEMAEAA